MSDDIEQVRIAVERDMATSGRDEASAALSRVESRLRDAEAERDRQERYIESLEAERHQWKAGTFPGWTRDDVYKELADKYRELEAERDELRGALERTIARQAPEGTGEA